MSNLLLLQMLISSGFNLFWIFHRIVPIARPVMIDQLQLKIKKAFGEELGINYENGAVGLQNH